MDKLVAVAARRANQQLERLKLAAEKRIKGLIRRADKAKTEYERNRLLQQAIQTAEMTEASVKKTRDAIERLKKRK